MASGVSDGALIVDTKMDNSGFMSNAKKFTNALNNLKQTAVKIGQAMGSAGNAYLKSVSEQEKAVRNLGSEYKQLQARVVELNREINRMQREGVNDGNRQAYNALNAELEQTVARMNEVRQAGSEVKSVSGGFRSLVASAGQAARTLAGMVGGGAFKFLQKLAAGAKNAAVQLAKLAARAAASSIKRLGSLFAGAAKSAWGFFRNLEKGNSGGGLQVSLKNLLRYGLGIRSLFVLFNRLRSAIKEGFAALAEQNPEVKASLGALSAALNGLKMALASAFAPILTAVTPALVALISLVTQAANAVGMLMAALTGKGFYSAAKGVASVGKAAGGAAGGVKKLNRELAGFDELTILKDNQSGGGGGGGGSGAGGQKFETVPVDSGIAEFVEHIKELFGEEKFEEIGGIIAGGISKAFQKALALLRGVYGERIGANIGKFLNGLFGDKLDWDAIGTTIGELLGVQLETVGATLGTFDLGKAAQGASTAFQAFSTTLSARMRKIPWTTIGQNFANGINSLFTLKNFIAAKNLLSTALKGVFSTISTAAKGVPWSRIGSDVGTTLSDFINNDIPWDTVTETFTTTAKGIFEFGSGFLDAFEADKAAENLKAALKKVPWGEIADAAWEFLSKALKKAGDFITVLFGGDVTKDAKDAVEAVEQMWDRHDGKKASVGAGGASDVGVGIGAGIGEAIGNSLSALVTSILSGFTEIITTYIPWGDLGDIIHDAIETIDWVDVGRKLLTAFSAVISSLDTLLAHIAFGGDYKDNKLWQALHHEESVEYLRNMVDQDIVPNFDVASNVLEDYIDKAVELGEPKYLDVLQENLPANYADLQDYVKTMSRAAQIRSEEGMTAAEAKAAADFEFALDKSGATEAIKNLNRAYEERGQLQTTEYINVAQRFGIDTGNVEQSYEEMLKTVFAKAVEIISSDDQISISDAIGRAEANLSTTPFLKPEDITFLEESLALAVQTQGRDLGIALTDGTVEGADAEMSAKESEIEQIFAQPYGFARRVNEVNSPSKLFEALGVDIVAGLINGLNTLPKALAGVWEKLPEWARALLGEAHGQFGVNLTGDSDGQRMQRQTNKELKQNTKALKKLKGKKTLLGLDTSGLNELADGTDVKVGVNFVPGSDKATGSETGTDQNANKGLLGWLQGIFNPGVGVDVAVSLLKNGWTTIDNFIGTFLTVLLGLGKSGWTTLGGFIGTFLTVLLGLGRSGWTSLGGFIGTFLTVLLGLGKSGWDSLGGFIGTFLTVLLGLGKSGWDSLGGFIGTFLTVLLGLGKSGWTTLGNYIGTFLTVLLGLGKSGWTTLGNFIGTALTVLLGLGKSGWTTLGGFIGTALTVLLGLGKNGWTTLGGFIGTALTILLSLGKSGWTTITQFFGFKPGNIFETFISLLKGDTWNPEANAAMTTGDKWVSTWRNLFSGTVDGTANSAMTMGDIWTSTWRNLFSGTVDGTANAAMTTGDRTVTTTENLAKGNKWSSDAEAGINAKSKTVTTTVNLVAGKISEFASKIGEGIKNAIGNVKSWLGIATGGAISAGGRLTRFAAGGAVSRAGALRWWDHIPKYAGGTSRAHGTMFVAGEAGPEIVGHINGKTEILNKSQLASTMYAAVQGGMLAALKGIQFHMPVMATGSVTPYAVASEAAQRDRALQDTMNNNNEDLIQAMVSAIGNAANAIITAVQAQGGNNHIAGLTSRQVLDEFNRAAMMYAASPLKGV